MLFSNKPICGKIVNTSNNKKIIHFLMDDGEHLVFNMEDPLYYKISKEILPIIDDEFCFIGGDDGKIKSVFKRDNPQDGFK